MNRWTGLTIAFLGCTGLAVAGGILVGTRRWNSATYDAVARLHAAMAIGPVTVVQDTASFVGLPAPVQRYLAFALPRGHDMIRSAHVEHAGDFALRPGEWKPFTSSQDITTDPPGFVWDARMPMTPLPVSVRVRDSYVEGSGASRAAVASLVPVGDQAGTPEIAASALWRYLAEAVWYPTALLPSERLTWSAIDDSTARATLHDFGATAVADFHFGASGEVVRVSGMRYRAVGGDQLLTPTEGHHRDYRLMNGMMIPTTGEVSWLLPEGVHTYWRARIVGLTYESGDRR